MNILGLNFYQHNASAAIVINGSLIAAVEEERFSRIKNDGNLPVESINFCLNQANINLHQVDIIAVSIDFNRLVKRKYLKYTLDNFPESNDLFLQNIINMKKLLGAEKYLRESLSYNGKIEYVKHHLAHMASSYYLSGYKESALVSLDGLGEIESTVIGVAKDNKIEIIQSVDFPHSLGMLYTSITNYLGFNSGSEGTLMALASFGDENATILNGKNKGESYMDIFNDMVNIEEGGMYTLNLSYFNFPYTKYGWVSDKFTNIFGPHKKYNDETTEHHKNIAAGLQKIFEKAYIHTIQFCQKQTNMTNLSLSGGSALNCVANGKIKSNSDFNNIYIQPATNDGGTSIGAALWLAHQKNKSLPISTYQDTTYLGPSFSDDKIKEALDLKSIKYKRVDDPSREAAILLSEHKVIGWFQGRMEFGPRALGNRSILGNPSKNNTKDFINQEVKHRESYRPFAPSVLQEHIESYFEVDQDSPFMLIACDVNKKNRRKIEAVIHVDDTARIQIVTEARNKKYYDLIQYFYQLTGIPVVLNTSFNDKGEPIVCSPEDALNTFDNTNLDALFLGHYMVTSS